MGTESSIRIQKGTRTGAFLFYHLPFYFIPLFKGLFYIWWDEFSIKQKPRFTTRLLPFWILQLFGRNYVVLSLCYYFISGVQLSKALWKATMKAIKLADWQEKNKKTEHWVTVEPCLICGTVKEGNYATYGDGGVCSRKCMLLQDQKPKYPEHTEEEFLKRFNLC